MYPYITAQRGGCDESRPMHSIPHRRHHSRPEDAETEHDAYLNGDTPFSIVVLAIASTPRVRRPRLASR